MNLAIHGETRTMHINTEHRPSLPVLAECWTCSQSDPTGAKTMLSFSTVESEVKSTLRFCV